MKHDHFCRPMSMILQGDTDQCRYCGPGAEPLDEEQLRRARYQARHSGESMHYEIVKHRRLAHALTFYK